MSSSLWRYLAKIGRLAIVFFGAAKIGLLLAFVNGNVSPVWPPAGISLAALLLFGVDLWPGIALGSFFATLSTGAPSMFVLGAALANTLEGLLGVYLLRRFD